MPNYPKLWELPFLNKWFKLTDDSYKLVRWEQVLSEDADSNIKYGTHVSFVFNFETEEIVNVEYISLNDILQQVGGMFTTVIASITALYIGAFGWFLKYQYTKKMTEKATKNKKLNELFEKGGKKLKLKKLEDTEDMEDKLEKMNNF